MDRDLVFRPPQAGAKVAEWRLQATSPEGFPIAHIEFYDGGSAALYAGTIDDAIRLGFTLTPEDVENLALAVTQALVLTSRRRRR